MDALQIEPSDELLCCRACLLTDCRLFDIHEYKLAVAFTDITGIPVHKRGRLPRYLCTYCHTLLLKCVSFRAASLRTQECLKSNLAGRELDTDGIRKIDRSSLRPANLIVTSMEIVEIEGVPNFVVAQKYAKRNNQKNNEGLYKNVKMEVSPQPTDLTVTSMEIVEIEPNNEVAKKHSKKTNNKTNNYFNKNVQTKVESDYDFTEQTMCDVDNDGDAYVRNSKFDHTYVRTEVIDTINKDNLNIELEAIEGGYKLQVVSEPNKKTPKRKIVDIEDTDISPVLTYEVTYVPKTNKSSLKKRGITKNGTDISSVVTYGVNKVSNKSAQTPKRNKTCFEKRDITKNTTIITEDNLVDLLEDETDTVIENTIDQISEVNCDEDNTINDAASDVWDSPEEPVLNIPPKLKRKRRKKKIDENECKLSAAERQKEFETELGVKITILSEQEQLEEIAARRQSAYYKESEFKCEKCAKVFKTKLASENHSLRHEPSFGELPCPICGVRFRHKYRVNDHCEKHRLRITCEQCGEVSRTRTAAREHHDEHRGMKFTCEYCGGCYEKRSSFLQHTRLSHPGRHLPCDQCGDTFIGEKGLLLHKTKMHNQNVTKFQCTVCSASFMSSDALDRHADSGEHVGVSPCEQCGMNCASEQELHAHKAIEHMTKTYICDECHVPFSNAAAFEHHFRLKHGEERPARGPGRRRPRAPPAPAVCDRCGRAFASISQLQLHYSVKHLLIAFPCTKCPKVFTAQHLMKRHMQCHSANRERSYRCPECPLAFFIKSTLKQHHDRVHLGIPRKRYISKCPLCAVVCLATNLRAHIDAVHYGERVRVRSRTRRNK